jgi:serine/threonine-protein kinase RIO1
MMIEILRFAGLGVSRRKSGGVWVYKEMANLKPLYIAIHDTLLPPWN